MDFIARVSAKYEYLKIEDVISIVGKAKMFYYSLRYPCDLSVDEETAPIKSLREQEWVLSACDEIIERLGISSSVGYNENGVRWSFDGAELSDRLVSMIVPIASVI
jgi:hypothetical protein